MSDHDLRAKKTTIIKQLTCKVCDCIILAPTGKGQGGKNLFDQPSAQPAFHSGTFRTGLAARDRQTSFIPGPIDAQYLECVTTSFWEKKWLSASENFHEWHRFLTSPACEVINWKWRRKMRLVFQDETAEAGGFAPKIAQRRA